MSIQPWWIHRCNLVSDPKGDCCHRVVQVMLVADHAAAIEAMRVACIESCIALVREWIYADEDHEGEELFAAMREVQP